MKMIRHILRHCVIFCLLLCSFELINSSCHAGTLYSSYRPNYRIQTRNYYPRGSRKNIRYSTEAARWAYPISYGGSKSLSSNPREQRALKVRRADYDYQMSVYQWLKKVREKEFKLAQQDRQRKLREVQRAKAGATRMGTPRARTQTNPMVSEPSIFKEGMIARLHRRSAEGRRDNIFLSQHSAPQPTTNKAPGFWQRLKKSLFG